MAEKVEIEIAAIDSASGVISDIFTLMQSGLKGSALAAGAATVAVGAVVGVVATSINSFLQYSEVVKDFARNTGLGVEEASRLIQVGDDVRLSAESMQAAFKRLAKDGVEVSIESMKKLADEYVKTEPADRAKFLLDNFGKSGMEMGKLLEKGAAGIDVLNKGVEENLILTDAAMAKAEAYKQAQDKLNDSWEGTKVALGEITATPLTGFLDDVNVSIQYWTESLRKANAEASKNDKIYNYATAIQKLNKEMSFDEAAEVAKDMIAAQEATDKMSEAQSNLTPEIVKTAEQLKIEADALKAVTAANNDLLSLTMSIQSENDNYSSSLSELTQKQADLSAEIAKGGSTEHIAELTQEYSDAGVAIDELKAKHQEAMQSIAYDLLVAKLKADGFSDAEFDMAIQAGVSMGQLDQATADLAVSYNDLASQAAGMGPGGAEWFANEAKKLQGVTGAATAATGAVGRVKDDWATAGDALTPVTAAASGLEMKVKDVDTTTATTTTSMQKNFDKINTQGAVGQIQAVIDAANSIPTDITIGITTPTTPGTGGSSPDERDEPGYARGGWISAPGDGSVDTRLVPLANGEYVVNSKAARQNAGLLEAINSGQDVGGGQIVNIYGPVTLELSSADAFSGR